MRLHVRPGRTKEFLGAINRQRFDLVNHLAPAVPAFARIALGVLVGQNATDRLTHSRGNEIFACDQLKTVTLTVVLKLDQVKDWIAGGDRYL